MKFFFWDVLHLEIGHLACNHIHKCLNGLYLIKLALLPPTLAGTCTLPVQIQFYSQLIHQYFLFLFHGKLTVLEKKMYITLMIKCCTIFHLNSAYALMASKSFYWYNQFSFFNIHICCLNCHHSPEVTKFITLTCYFTSPSTWPRKS